MSARCVHGDPLLDELESLRWWNSGADSRGRLEALCTDATRAGIFLIIDDPVQMVDNYGPLWFEFAQPHECLCCAADLCDHLHGPPFKREISVYDRARDRTVSYRCPDCDHEWPR